MDIDIDDETCLWGVRDPATWRAGVLLAASADLFVHWHAVAAAAPSRRWAHVARRCDEVVDRLRWARLAASDTT
jgi:hypothetical protein